MLLINVGSPRPRCTAELVLCAAAGLWAAGLLAAGTAGGVLVAGWLVAEAARRYGLHRSPGLDSLLPCVEIEFKIHVSKLYLPRCHGAVRVGRWLACWLLLCCAGQLVLWVGAMW